MNFAGKYKNKTVLITGSTGFIGSSLARAFFNVDCRLRLLDMNDGIKVPGNAVASIKLIKGDLTQENVLKNALKGADFVFHLAALEYDRLNFDIYKDMRINTLIVVSVLEICRKNNFNPKIIFSSSANLFGLANSIPLNEKSESDPVSLWSAHKLMAEHYLKIYAVKYGVRIAILRLTNVYGPAYNRNVWGNVVVNKVIAHALAGRDIYLYRNRGCLRDYLYIDDVVNAFLLAGAAGQKSAEKQYYVIGTGQGLKMAEVWKIIADEVGKRTGKKIKIQINKEQELEPFDFRDFVADSRLFSRKTGWTSSMTLRNGIRSTIDAMLPSGGSHGSN